jgi:hypothetical protein
MGTRNRVRRRVKRAGRGRAERVLSGRRHWENEQAARWGGAGRSHGPTDGRAEAEDREAAIELIYAAAHARCTGRGDGPRLTEALVRADFAAGGRAVVVTELERAVCDHGAVALMKGWQPSDLWEISRRRAGGVASSLLAGLLPGIVARSRAAYGRYGCTYRSELKGKRRLDPAGGEWPADVAAAITLIDTLAHLPALDDLTSMGAVGESNADPRRTALLAKIRSLLAKAESTGFDDEADAFTGKAAELMARHRIDRASVEADKGARRGPRIIARRCWIEAPYVDCKAILCSVVARANDCRAIQHRLGFVTLVGEAEDLDMTELLYTSLLVQATRQMTLVGKRSVDGEESTRARLRLIVGDLKRLDARERVEPPGASELLAAVAVAFSSRRERRPSFRRSFLVAFATRIGARLAESNRRATEAAETELGRAFLPVLAGRQQAVDDAVERAFGRLDQRTLTVTDSAGWAAGVAAADLADLNVRSELRTN